MFISRAEVTKAMSEEDADKVRAKNEEVRKQRDENGEQVANKFSCFKRDFMGAPIWRALQAIIKKSGAPKPSQIDYRKDERYWVLPEAEAVTVTFEVNIEHKED